MGITREQADKIIKKIKRTNRLLQENEETKYNLFKDYDPFADQISESLLNGNDVAKYALVTGMLEPFDIERLSGVTYSAKFSGDMYYYAQGESDVRKKSANEDGYYEISPNSITYLEIDTMFRVPNYMVLRFNLRVKNVYKGLLLGTGPIIDSGFVGKIFIPLHNLTSNTYWIKKGAKLIEIEFTKISKLQNCPTDIETALKKLDYDRSAIKNIDFSVIPPLTNNIGENREFEEYIKSSLSDKNFGAKDNVAFVCNSISTALNEIKQSKEDVCTIRENVENSLKEAKIDQDKFKEQAKQDIAEEQVKINDAIKENERHESIMRSFSVIALIAMLLTAVGLGITAANYFYQGSELKLKYSSVQEDVNNNERQIDKKVQDITRALDTIAQNTSFEDTDVKKEISDIVNQLKSDNTSTARYDSNNDLPLYFTFSVVALLLSIAIFILFIIFFIKSSKISSKIKKLEDAINQQLVDRSEDNSNEKSN